MIQKKRHLRDYFYKPLIISLTLGASLIIGLLSFGGFYALWPSIGLAMGAFVLSVAYEGEIYFQNIKGALKKLFRSKYSEEALARRYLLDYFPSNAFEQSKWPALFIDYAEELLKLHLATDAKLQAEKDAAEHRLEELEQEFYAALHAKETTTRSTRAEELYVYLAHYKKDAKANPQSLIKSYQDSLTKGQLKENAIRVFSGLTALFMSIGTSYLLVETFALIPFLAVIPFGLMPAIIIPMAVISGIAYGLLTYNSIKSMLHNSTLSKRFNQIVSDFKTHGLTVRTAFLALSSVLLFGLAIALTLCTAGTWLTIMRETRPLFQWMTKIPSSVISITTAIFTSLSALVFNLENSSESLDMLDEASRSTSNPFQDAFQLIRDKFNALRKNETLLQLLNPFRALLVMTITPLRFLLFIGHLLSIGLTADRVPGVSKFGSACLGFVSEFFEDLHYFMHLNKPHSHDTQDLLKERLSENAGHNHDDDLPTRLLRFLCTPILLLSRLWHQAWQKAEPTPVADIENQFVTTRVPDSSKIIIDVLTTDAPEPQSISSSPPTVIPPEEIAAKLSELASAPPACTDPTCKNQFHLIRTSRGALQQSRWLSPNMLFCSPISSSTSTPKSESEFEDKEAINTSSKVA